MITRIVAPVVQGRADIVIGNRRPWTIKYFSPIKRLFQFFGNSLARRLAGTDVPDMVSGFRAYSREAMLTINVTTKYSYVLDTIIQAVNKGLVIESVPINVNPPSRRSRLFDNIFQHMLYSGLNILRVYIIYRPLKVFINLAVLLSGIGVLLIFRFLYFYWTGDGSGHVQSLVIASIFLFFSAAAIILGVVAGLIGLNRKLIEEQLYLFKKNLYHRER